MSAAHSDVKSDGNSISPNSEIEKDFECATCLETLSSPVLYDCPAKHAACKTCAEQWVSNKNTCPCCNVTLKTKTLEPVNHLFTKALAIFKKQQEQIAALKMQVKAASSSATVKKDEAFPAASDKAIDHHHKMLAFYQSEIEKKRRDLICVLFAKRARIHQLLRRILGDDDFNKRDEGDSNRRSKVERILKDVGFVPFTLPSIGLTVSTAVMLAPSKQARSHYLTDRKDSKVEKNINFAKYYRNYKSEIKKAKQDQIEVINKLEEQGRKILDELKSKPLEAKNCIPALQRNANEFSVADQLYQLQRNKFETDAQHVWKKRMVLWFRLADLNRQRKRYNTYQKKLTNELATLNEQYSQELKNTAQYSQKNLKATPKLFGGSWGRMACSPTAKVFEKLTETELNFCAAVKEGNLFLARQIYSSNTDIDMSCIMSARDSKTLPAVVKLIKDKRMDVIKFILDETNFDVNCAAAQDLDANVLNTGHIRSGYSMLTVAAQHDDVTLARLLIAKNGINLNQKSSIGRAAIHFAHSLDMFRVLVDAGANTELTYDGKNAVQHAKLNNPQNADGYEKILSEHTARKLKK